MEQRDGSQRACLERMCQEFLNASTPMENLSAIDDLNPDREDVVGAQVERLNLSICVLGNVHYCSS